MLRPRSLRKALMTLMTDERLKDPLPALRRLPPGSWVILRFMPVRGLPNYAETLMAECRCRRLKLLVSGDWRLAARLKADGLHLPEQTARRGCLSSALCWLKANPQRLFSISAHNRLALSRAQELGADAALLSPVFPTASHPQAKSLGLLSFRKLTRQKNARAVIALGGINAKNLRSLASCKIAGLAGISLFLEDSR